MARDTCDACRRPRGLCWCAYVPRLPTRTRIVLLQHPRERDVAIGTARMASLCLPNAELHVGVSWEASPALARALADPARPPALLYPGEGARDVTRDPPRGPVTLVVVDGTWWQARKVLKTNPTLAALPRLSFRAGPSEYRIRREPDAACVSTIEALAHVLGALEDAPERFSAMLRPFRAMIDAQIACEQSLRARRARRERPLRPPRDARAPLAARRDDLVCVVTEANAWPRRSARPDELVRCSAERVHTGERIDLLLAPRGLLAPATATHVGLPEVALRGGRSLETFREQWAAFVRPSDVLATWGPFPIELLERAGSALPHARVDVRKIARDVARGGVGSASDHLASVGVAAAAPALPGRAGARLAELVALTRHLTTTAAP